MASSREKILNRLKQASDRRKAADPVQPDPDAPIYVTPDKDLADAFQENLELVSGDVYRMKNRKAAVALVKQMVAEENWTNVFCLDGNLQQALLEGKVSYSYTPEEFKTLQVGITPCEALVSHLGSVVVSSGGASGRRLHVFPETHIVIAHKGQLVGYLDDALEFLQEKYGDHLPSMITNITGPSRTADIEKTLVKGMHGPRKLLVFLCDEPF